MSPQETEEARWFAEEVHPHETALRNCLRVWFPTFNDIDDLVQEAYVRLFRARTHRRVNDPKPYLFATARNTALDFFRHERAVTIQRVAEFDCLSLLDTRPDAAESASRQEELLLLAEAIRILPERCRQVMVLRKHFGISQREIAAQLGITENTVAAQVAIGMRRCRAYFRDHQGEGRRTPPSFPPISDRASRPVNSV